MNDLWTPASRPMDEPVPESGNLADTGFPELLKRLHDGLFSGALVVCSDEIEKAVLFREGRLIFARSNNADDRLGEFLLSRGLISLNQYLESSTQISPGKRQGTVLCELGAISPDDLFRYVKDQVSEIICSLFLWRNGRFETRLGDDGAEETIVLSIPIEDIILRGIRRVSDWSRIWRGIGGSCATRFAPTPSADSLGYHAQLSQDEAHVLSCVNGERSVGRILELSYAANFETCRILWALLLVGAIEPARVDPGMDAVGEDYALAELVEGFDGVFTVIHGFVAERLGDLVDHFMDQAVDVAVPRHPETLAKIELRNQGRVEYEQIYANLRDRPQPARLEEARRALTDLLVLLLELTDRELGPEEESLLQQELERLAEQFPGVPLAAVVEDRRKAGHSARERT